MTSVPLRTAGSSACNIDMAMTHFRDLQVWQRSMALAQAIYTATRQFPKEELFGLTSQLRRSAVSIPSNIAEGQGRESDKSFALFVTQAQGSLYEVETQIELARNLEMMSAEQAAQLLAEASEIGRMIHGLLRALRQAPTPVWLAADGWWLAAGYWRLPYTSASRPCFSTTDRSLSAIPLGCFAPVSHFSMVDSLVLR